MLLHHNLWAMALEELDIHLNSPMVIQVDNKMFLNLMLQWDTPAKLRDFQGHQIQLQGVWLSYLWLPMVSKIPMLCQSQIPFVFCLKSGWEDGKK